MKKKIVKIKIISIKKPIIKVYKTTCQRPSNCH